MTEEQWNTGSLQLFHAHTSQGHRARAPVPRHGYHVFESVALVLRDTDGAKAETYFHRVLAVARQQQAKSWELRASMSLARLWRDQGKGVQARELLAPVYGWFTEGFETRDLKEAKVLLEELAA